MRALGAVMIVLLATSAAAKELSEAQQAAYDAVLPSVNEALEAQGGETMLAFAPQLTECVITTAKSKELPAFEDGEMSVDDISLVNEIMARPKTQRCLTKALK